MTSSTIAAVQLRSVPGDVSANLNAHLHWVRLAADSGAGLVSFPELSITGYEPTLAKSLAFAPDSEPLSALQMASDELDIHIGIGLPLAGVEGVTIGMLWFGPHQPRQAYRKQQLHSDEFPFFVACQSQLIVPFAGYQIAPAICYESMQQDHADSAVALGASLYLASVAKAPKDIPRGEEHYPRIAKQYSMPVIMVNAIGPSDNFVSAGQSAAWGPDGNLLAKLDAEEEGLLLVDLKANMAHKLDHSALA